MSLRKLLTWLTRPVDGGTITSMAGGFSGVRAGIRVTPEDRANSVLRSKHSRVGKSRFNEEKLQARVARVRKALLDEGAHPPYHRRQVERLRQEWPTLYHAIQDLVKP